MKRLLLEIWLQILLDITGALLFVAERVQDITDRLQDAHDKE
jgi:hypothetical protein